MKYKISFSLLLLLTVFLNSCRQNDEKQSHTRTYKETEEYKIHSITLAGEASLNDAEISGLAWYGDYLILLPQYPFKLSDNTSGAIYKIKKERILDFINGKDESPIQPEKILFVGEGLTRFNKLGQGYESIAFNGEDVYLTIESYENFKMIGYVVKGRINKETTKIELDAKTLMPLEPQADIFNLSDETIFIYKNQIYTLYEGNGRNINKNPHANKFDSDLNSLGKIKFLNEEYRITDASSPDSSGKFWAINYMYSGDWDDFNPVEDEEVKKYGIGKSHKTSQTVERLLEFQILENSIIRTETPPLQFELLKNNKGRNWEGLVKLENYEFLVVTDYYPKTILGYIACIKK